MYKLIQLELRKNKCKPYLYAVLGLAIAIIALGLLFKAIPTLEPNNPSSQEFKNPKTLITIVSLLSMNAFALLSAVMYAKFVIEEYTGKKSILLFTYPQKRSQLLFAKFAFVFGFIFVTMFAVNSMTCLIVLIGQTITVKDILLIVQFTVFLTFVANFIGLIALRIGFYKKSLITPIIAALILTIPFSNSVSLLRSDSFGFIWITTILFLFLSAITFMTLLKKVDKMECLS